VGDAGRHLAEHGELGGLDQFILGGAQGLLGALALGDFALQAGDRFGRSAVRAATLRSSSSLARSSMARASSLPLAKRRR
jgi:hypothetical protein